MAAIEAYLKVLDSAEDSVRKLLSTSDGIRALLAGNDDSAASTESWAEEPYVKCPHHPEHLQYATVTGERVRSKSEAYIFDALYQRGIPFRYDCALTLGGRTIYPDFIIMHPVTKEIYIWEHFGLLDDPEYFSGAKQKVNLYMNNGYLPCRNLIITYESSDHPFNSGEILDLIDHFC